MKIGLIDVDSHAKRKKWGATIYPNLALTHIAGWHRYIGNTVEWYDPFSLEGYDIVYMSKVFSFTPDYPHLIANARKVYIGGTGYISNPHDRHYTIDLKQLQEPIKVTYTYLDTLPARMERAKPDYSIYPNVPRDYAYGFLTRGCPNRCPWCVVPRKEGPVRPHMDVDDIAIDGRTKLVLMDNNFLAAGDYAHQQLDKIIARGYRVDFNQALDARLINDDFARQLARVRWLDKNRIRFGCDTPRQVTDCERAIDMITSHGFTGQFFIYTMLTSDFQESYARVNHFWQRLQQQRSSHNGRPVYAYAKPYRDPQCAPFMIER